MKKQLFNILGSLLVSLMVLGCEKDRVSNEVSSFSQSVVPTQITNDLLPGLYANNRVSSTANYPDWMKYISDEQLIGNLTIPGSHNSGAIRDAPGVAYGLFRCQENGIPEQLNAGIRAFDIRLKANNDKLSADYGKLGVFHESRYMVDLDRNVLMEITEFLRHHPSETIIIFVKREGGDENMYNKSIKSFIKGYTRVLLSNDDYHGAFTKLKDCRGKIILLHRNSEDYDNWEPKFRGEKITSWPNNSTGMAEGLYGKYKIEDNYSVPNLIRWAIDNKKNQIFGNLAEAKKNANAANIQYVTYTSGTSLAAYPIHVAKRLNVPTADFVNKQLNPASNEHLGIIMSDFVTISEGKQLISACVMDNIYSKALDPKYR